MQIKYLIEHKNSRLYVKEFDKKCTLTTDHNDCIHFSAEESAQRVIDLSDRLSNEEFEVVEHGFHI